MTDDIDIPAVIASLQHENERLRLTLLKSRAPLRSPIHTGTLHDASLFLEKHYLLIMVAAAVISLTANIISDYRSIHHAR